MEQARLFIAIALSFLVFLIWGKFFVEEPVQKEALPQSEQVAKEEAPKEPYAREIVEPETDTPTHAASTDREPRTITISTPLYILKISEKGAVFQSFTLKDYKETVDEDSPLKEIISPKIVEGTIRTGFTGKSLPGLGDALFSTDLETDMMDVLHQPGTVSFSWRSPQGIVLEKHFRFLPDTCLIGLTVTVKNGSDLPIQDNLTVSLLNTGPKTSSTYSFEGPSALINNGLEQIKIDDIEDQDKYSGNIKWTAIESRYFISSIIPAEPGDAAGMHLILRDKETPVVESRYVHPARTIRAGEHQNFDFSLFLGPKRLDVLRSLNNDLDKAIDFGWFDVIAKPCLSVMNFLYGFIPNYGVAIIVLTVFIKLILWPLGNKSYKSMNEMKTIQPLMAEIREKYKDDKKQMNQELMNLYKTYKINPMGGCLPMILQIPIFIALYRMLYEAIELRHAPFLWWINALAAPDRLFRFDVSIPFMEPPYGIPVLTIIMGATMLLQQKMSPPPGDPAQAKMMMFMPIVFTVIFINFSSGLVLYWLVNNILSISQQYYISKKSEK